MSQSQPSVQLKVTIEKNSARLQYEIRNTLDRPVYVFDRLYDMRTQKLSSDWAYIAVEGQKAIVSRQVWPLPEGLRHDSPETPYGRLVAPDSSVNGKISLELPLVERDPYFSLLHANAKPVPLNVTSLILRIGWGLASELRAGSAVELEGEKLVLFPYHEAISKQRLADSDEASLMAPAVLSR